VNPFVVEATIPPVCLLTEEQATHSAASIGPQEAKLTASIATSCFIATNRKILAARMGRSASSRAELLAHTRDGDELFVGRVCRLTTVAMPATSEPNPCGVDRIGHWEEIAGVGNAPDAFDCWAKNQAGSLLGSGRGGDQSRIWDYSTACGIRICPLRTKPAALPGLNKTLSDYGRALIPYMDDSASTCWLTWFHRTGQNAL